MMVIGEMTTKDTLRAVEHVVAEKDIKVEGSIYVGNKLDVNGNINTNGSIYIKNNAVMSIVPGSGNPALPPIGDPTTDPKPTITYYGPQPNTQTINETSGTNSTTSTSGVCSSGEYNPWTVHNFGGVVQVYDNSGNGVDYNVGGSLLKMVSWPTCSSIDVSGGTVTGGNGGLLMNYFCGKDIYMCTGSNGGVVSTGRNFEIGMPRRNMQAALNMNLRTDITQAITILNPAISGTKYVFEVASDGKTYIGIQRPLAPHNNAMLSVDGKIACKSLYVLKPASWADFVFKTNNLEKLSSVEKYINENKHLPGLPSEEEIINNGYDVNEMNAKLLEKIETLYLHIIKLEKEVDQLKNK